VFVLQEEHDGGESTLHILSTSTRVLFDTGAVRSFISQTFAHKFKLNIEQLAEPVCIYSPLGAQLTLGSFYRAFLISIGSRKFLFDLILMKFSGLDAILGVDWLQHYHATIDVASKTITISVPDEEPLTYSFCESDGNFMGSLISQALLEDGDGITLSSIRVALEFEDVF